MATNEQVKLLVKAHFDSEDRFRTTVLQIAASEASKGKANFARDLKTILDSEKNKKSKSITLKGFTFNDLISSTLPENKIGELIVSEETLGKINKIILEYHNRDKIKSYGLNNRRKILLEGKPGTGKTMTASILAHELNLPLCTVLMDKMVTKYMGETSTKLRQIFDDIYNCKGVYLFDEFDTIGGERNLDNDVGEIRRVLNTFLQLIENDKSDSIIIAATNNVKMLDQALFRRFDDIIHYDLPSKDEIRKLINSRLGCFKNGEIDKKIIDDCVGMSQSEIVRICDDSIKEAILNDSDTVNFNKMYKMVGERKKTSCRGD